MKSSGCGSGLPLEWLTKYVERVDAMTPAEIRRVVGLNLQDEQAVIVVVGDAATVKAQLAPFGEVHSP